MAIAPVVAALLIDSPIPGTTRALAGILWILCLAPAIHYSGVPRSRRRPLPFLPSIGIAFGLYFVLPVVLGAYNHYYRVVVNPATDYDIPVQLALIAWIIMLASYALGGIFRGAHRLTSRPLQWEGADVAAWGLALLFGALSVTLIKLTFAPDFGSAAVMQFVLSVQWLGIAFLTVAVRQKVLGKLQIVLFGIGGAFTIALMLGGGSIAPLVQLAVIVAYALWLTGVRVRTRWIVLGAVIMSFAIAARGVAIDFRFQAWIGQLRLTPTQRAALMLRLIQNKIESEGIVATVTDGADATFQRSANMDLFADVVRRTPSEIPHWNGYSYASLVGSFVPRALLPNKPTKEIGQAFGHRYGYLYYTNLSTSINLPFFVEFYVNYGVLGVLVGMMIVGLIYRLLDELVNSPDQDILASLIGVIVLVPLLMIESDFSLTFGGLILNGMVLYTLITFIRRNSARFASNSSDPRYRVVVATSAFGAPMIQIEQIRRSNPAIDRR
jgi:hypothetical protein